MAIVVQLFNSNVEVPMAPWCIRTLVLITLTSSRHLTSYSIRARRPDGNGCGGCLKPQGNRDRSFTDKQLGTMRCEKDKVNANNLYRPLGSVDQEIYRVELWNNLNQPTLLQTQVLPVARAVRPFVSF